MWFCSTFFVKIHELFKANIWRMIKCCLFWSFHKEIVCGVYYNIFRYSKIKLHNKNKRPLINNSVFNGLSFLLQSISAITSSNAVNIFRFFSWIVYFNIFKKIISIARVLIKASESLKCFLPAPSRLWISNWYFASYRSLRYKWILSISCWWLITLLIYGFVFQDPEPPANNILYGWSGICGQFALCFFMSSFVI